MMCEDILVDIRPLHPGKRLYKQNQLQHLTIQFEIMLDI